MNCFQFDYFCGYHTAQIGRIDEPTLLWIAFNLITFVDITQPLGGWKLQSLCCELLSIWLLLWISHSKYQNNYLLCNVVNCFQFDYFCGYHTAPHFLTVGVCQLWIAFNLITFVDITQRRWIKPIQVWSCELLSIWLLLWISHSTS